jgi:hypothetical protein
MESKEEETFSAPDGITLALALARWNELLPIRVLEDWTVRPNGQIGATVRIELPVRGPSERQYATEYAAASRPLPRTLDEISRDSLRASRGPIPNAWNRDAFDAYRESRLAELRRGPQNADTAERIRLLQ